MNHWDYDRVRCELDYRFEFGGRGTIKRAFEFAAQDDPLLVALMERWHKDAEADAIKFYAQNVSALGDF